VKVRYDAQPTEPAMWLLMHIFAVAVAGHLPIAQKADATRSLPVIQSSPADMLNQARNMASDLLSGTRSRAEDAYHAAHQYADKATRSVQNESATSTTPSHSTQSTSLPLEEKRGQRPGDHTAGVGATPSAIDEADVAVLPMEKSFDQGPSDKAVTAKEPGLEQSATDGVLDISGGGQSIDAAAVDRVDKVSATAHEIPSSGMRVVTSCA
jgi:hypothetical protein